jgi:hypothetical protein
LFKDYFILFRLIGANLYTARQLARRVPKATIHNIRMPYSGKALLAKEVVHQATKKRGQDTGENP